MAFEARAYMPLYNSIAARGKVSPLGGPAGALSPPAESELMDGALGGFFDHMLAGNKKATKQERLNALLIERDNTLANLKSQEARQERLHASRPIVNTPAYDAHLKDKRAGIIPEYQMFNGTKYRPNWAQGVGGDPMKLRQGSPLEAKLLHIDAEIKRLGGVEGYDNRGQTFLNNSFSINAIELKLCSIFLIPI